MKREKGEWIDKEERDRYVHYLGPLIAWLLSAASGSTTLGIQTLYLMQRDSGFLQEIYSQTLK